MRNYTSLVDRIDAAAVRHDRLLSILAGVLFALSCASYAGFIRLPQLNLLTSWPAIALTSIINAVWWGFIRPHALERREQGCPDKAVD